ncbi:Uncharacterized protein BM_BM17646 [Brugia malayi]|uniref:Uncharacterized protein n=1 Tax=Brugia malayi TaxID=6279 RepID=A0A4E9FHY2_BRUMA|nr:Uncharacterized protein BM_BM17646 [Brugia malayi]VIO96487.1 Uncharacterized protein BM_BM17646 [Brugia malayi]
MEIDLSLFVMINNIDDEKNIWLCRQNQLKICYMIPFMKRISADVNDSNDCASHHDDHAGILVEADEH